VIPAAVKEFLVPGSITFLLLSLVPGVALLFRKRDGGRAGKIWLALLVLLYWVLSTPIAAVTLVDLFSPDFPPVISKADAQDATGIVLLGAGMTVHRSRGGSYGAPTREGSLRVLEAVRVYRLLGGVPIIATGGNGSEQYSEAGLMAAQLEQLGVPAGDIIKEEKSNNTRDHAMFVPPLLKQHHVEKFVLVTSRQHIARALATFRAAGANPIPSSPEVYVAVGVLEMYLPSGLGLYVSECMIYDLMGWVYYKARGWV
jgi:uncharacterized SAM-binding protein YcdF (DUF218 family)